MGACLVGLVMKIRGFLVRPWPKPRKWFVDFYIRLDFLTDVWVLRLYSNLTKFFFWIFQLTIFNENSKKHLKPPVFQQGLTFHINH